MTESKASARKIRGVELEVKATELRKRGYSYQDIGDMLGVTKPGAWGAVMRALAKLNKQVAENAAEVKQIELQRLDKLFLAMYKRAINGDYGAVDRCLRIMERRAKYQGLDEPAKSQVETLGEVIIRYQDEDLHKPPDTT